MKRVLMDTDVVSYILKRDTRARLFEPHLAGAELWMSFMTLAELERWAAWYEWGNRRRHRMKDYIRSVNVAWASGALCREWARITVNGYRKGRPIACADAWIAATAIHYDLPLVTNNLGHFSDVEGLRVWSPV